MKVKGIATLTKYTIKENGELEQVWEHTANNIINKRAITRFFQFGSVFDSTRKIALSEQNTAPDYEAQTLGQINAVGDDTLIPDPRTVTLRAGATPASLVIKNRFLPPASTRTINSLGIVDGATLVDDPSATTVRNSYTYILLGVAATQLPVEVLDVSYKIFIDWTGSRFGSNEQYQIISEWDFFSNPGGLSNNREIRRLSAISYTLSDFSSSPIGYTAFDETNGYPSIYTAVNTFQTLPITFTLLGTPTFTSENVSFRDVEYGRVGLKWGNNSGDDYLTEHYLGHPVRALLIGGERANFSASSYDTDPATTTPVVENFGSPEYYKDWPIEYLFDKVSDLSNVWSHEETSNTPMYDINELANSSLKPIIDVSVDTPDFPSEYFLKVVTSGGVGVGEYKLYKTSFHNFSNNIRSKLSNYAVSLFWEVGTDFERYKRDNEIVIFNPRWIYDWSFATGDVEIVTWEQYKGIAILRVRDTGVTESHRFPLSTYTQFGTRINDIAVDPVNDKIYVASETGLYEIVVTGATVSQLDADACASVTVGDSGQVFAIFRDGAGSGRLSSSIGANWATALDLTGASINWDNVWRIFIDPNSTDYDLMIYEGPTPKHTWLTITDNPPVVTTYFHIHWWNNPSKFIQTDSFSHDLPDNNDCVVNELDVLKTNYSVQVTNGVWIYPTTPKSLMMNTGIGSSRDAFADQECSGSWIQDYRDSAASEGIGWQRRCSNSSFSDGWNNSSSTPVEISFDVPLADNVYAFGFHATAPFHTEDFRGSISKLLVGKPTPVATTYDLCFFMDVFQWSNPQVNVTTTASGFRSAGVMFKLSVDEGGTSTLKNYANDRDEYRIPIPNSETLQFYQNIVYHPIGDKQIMALVPPLRKVIVLNEFSGLLEPTATRTREIQRQSGGIFWMSPVYYAPDDLNDIFIQAYEWDGANWILDPDNTGPGKPAHTSTDALIDGLTIRWNEELPGNPQPLILDQYYNFVKITEPNTFLVETSTPLDSGECEIYFRECPVAVDSGTVPGSAPHRIYLPEAPLGSAPDSLWLSLPPDMLGTQFSATINGSPVDILIDASTNPAPGTIHITDTAAGEAYFAAADSSQPYTINYFYIRKYDVSEVL